MTKKSVSIIIPNYNGRELLERFLPFTVAAIKNAAVDYEIIVIDDASTDDSIGFVKTHYPDIILLENQKNSGFSATCNVGISRASKDLMLILNSDIKLSANYFENQWQCFNDERTFGVMGRIIENNTHDAPRLSRKKGLQFVQNVNYTVQSEDKPVPTLFLSGANALVCAKKIKEIGGFDEIFTPFYYEDTDLSVRACRLGWKCYYSFQSTCDHLGSSTVKSSHRKKKVKTIYYRNRFILHAIHLSTNQFKWFKVQTLFLTVIPKILMGKFWIWESLNSLKSYESAIEQSKSRLNKHSEITGELLPLFSLRELLLAELQKLKINFRY